MLTPESHKSLPVMKVVEGALSATLLSGCAGVGITPKTPEITASYPAFSQTWTPEAPTLTATPSPSPTETLTPTPSPLELMPTPDDPSTWSGELQDYWAHPDPGSWSEYGVKLTDEQVDTIFTESRRARFLKMAQENEPQLRDLLTHLVKGNFTTVLTQTDVQTLPVTALESDLQSMNPDDLRSLEIIYQAENKGILRLTPDEIRSFQSDKRAGVVVWRKFDQGNQVYGFWDWGSNPGVVDKIHQNLMAAWYPAMIFGKEVDVQRYAMFGPSWFDEAGVVELPGEAGYALLARLKTESGENVFQLFSLLLQPRTVGQQDACLTLPVAFYQHQTVACPAHTLQPTQVYAEGKGSLGSLTTEKLRQTLRWPPPLLEAWGPEIIVGPPTPSQQNYQGVLENGLEIIDHFYIQTAKHDNIE